MYKERWRDIPGFSNYEVSDLGRVRRKDGKPMALRPDKRVNSAGTVGYLKTDLYNDKGKRKTIRVHILVALAFLGKIARGKVVNHVDGVKHNCSKWNLEITTQAWNTRHAYLMGLRRLA